MARKYTQISLKDKMHIINQLAKGRHNTKIAKEFNTNKSTISLIYEKRNFIFNTLTSGYMKTLRRTKYYTLNKAILIYLRQAVAFNENLSGPIIKAKANSLSKKLGLKDFDATNSWLTKFKMKCGIDFSTLWCFKTKKYKLIREQFLTDSEIVQKVKDSVKEEIFENCISIAIDNKFIAKNNAEDDQSEEDKMEDEVENKSCEEDVVQYKSSKEDEVQEEINNMSCEEEREEDELDRNYDSTNDNKSWLQDINIIVNDSFAENPQGRVINALKIVNNTLNSFDIVPNDVFNAFTSVETFIEKEISGDNNI